ncbi:F-box only protein 39-like [Physella acuta]|uniref:F-box only protein 39-like n=1 Tax=Physella acuta TaxID=109671 RepID=UPI0027DBDDAA|nr:F-box only protein 39-like [Physella acuta]
MSLKRFKPLGWLQNVLRPTKDESSGNGEGEATAEATEPPRPLEATHASWAKLPYVVLVRVLSLLPDKNIWVASQVCKDWRNAARDPSLWRVGYFMIGPNSLNSVTRLVQFAGVHGKHVKVMKITWGTFTSKLLKRTVHSLFAAIEPTRLKVFDLEEVDWKRFGIKVRTEILDGLKKVLSVQDSLEELSMRRIRLEVQAGAELLQIVTDKLTNLDIVDYFDDKGAVSFAPEFGTALSKFVNLKILALNYCYLSGQILEHFATIFGERPVNLQIFTNEEEPNVRVTSEMWNTLKLACPKTQVTLSVPSNAMLVEDFENILSPAMPLFRLDMFLGTNPQREDEMLQLLVLRFPQLQHLDLELTNNGPSAQLENDVVQIVKNFINLNLTINGIKVIS